MLLHPLYRRYRRKVSRERRLAFLGAVLVRLGERKVSVGFEADEFGESVPTAVSLRRLAKIGQARRIIGRLADQAARSGYSPDEPPVEGKASHSPLAVEPEAQDGGNALHGRVERILENCRPWERRLLQMRFGIDGQDRLTEEQIARKLGCSVRTVERRVKATLAVLNAMA